MSWLTGETRTFRYVHRSQPTPEGAMVLGFDCHHDQHSVLVEDKRAPEAPAPEAPAPFDPFYGFDRDDFDLAKELRPSHGAE